MTQTAHTETEPGRAEKIRGLIDRTIKRSIKGVDYFLSAAPAQGVSQNEIIFRHGTALLRHYFPLTDEVYRVPVMIIAPLTNRGLFLDILPGMSFVEYLLRNGYDVYMLEWDAPRPEERKLCLADYTQRIIPDCINRVQAETGEFDVSVIGYCIAGVLTSIYAATHSDGPLKNLVLLNTPIDWSQVSFLSTVVNPDYFNVDHLVDSVGNVPSDMVLQGFNLVDPIKPVFSRLELWENMLDDDYIRVRRKYDRWLYDMLPVPGELFRELVKELIWGNKLFDQTLRVAGLPVKLSNIRAPLLNIMALHDNVIPYKATEPLLDLVSSSDKQNVILKGGHMSLVAGPNAPRRMWPQLDAWLAERSM